MENRGIVGADEKWCVIEKLKIEMDMCAEGEENGMSQGVSQTENCELRMELPLELVARLAQQAAAAGVSLEQLVAQEVRKLAE